MVTLSALAVLITWNILLVLWPGLVHAVPRPQDLNYFNATTPNTTTPLAISTDYWVGSIQRQGKVAFGSDASYSVFRNVKDFGAKGEFLFWSLDYFVHAT